MGNPRIIHIIKVSLLENNNKYKISKPVEEIWEEWHPMDIKAIGQKGENYSTFDEWIDKNKEKWIKELGCPLIVDDVNNSMEWAGTESQCSTLCKKYKRWKSPKITIKPKTQRKCINDYLHDMWIEGKLPIVKTFFIARDGRKKLAKDGDLFGEYFDKYPPINIKQNLVYLTEIQLLI